jgi:hypothetical protein
VERLVSYPAEDDRAAADRSALNTRLGRIVEAQHLEASQIHPDTDPFLVAEMLRRCHRDLMRTAEPYLLSQDPEATRFILAFIAEHLRALQEDLQRTGRRRSEAGDPRSSGEPLAGGLSHGLIEYLRATIASMISSRSREPNFIPYLEADLVTFLRRAVPGDPTVRIDRLSDANIINVLIQIANPQTRMIISHNFAFNAQALVEAAPVPPQSALEELMGNDQVDAISIAYAHMEQERSLSALERQMVVSAGMPHVPGALPDFRLPEERGGHNDVEPPHVEISTLEVRREVFERLPLPAFLDRTDPVVLREQAQRVLHFRGDEVRDVRVSPSNPDILLVDIVVRPLHPVEKAVFHIRIDARIEDGVVIPAQEYATVDETTAQLAKPEEVDW